MEKDDKLVEEVLALEKELGRKLTEAELFDIVEEDDNTSDILPPNSYIGK